MRILCLTPWFPAWPGAQSGNFIMDSLLALKGQGHEITTLLCQPWHPTWGGILHEDWGRPLLRAELHDPALNVSLLRYPSIPRNYCRAVGHWLFKHWIVPPLRKRIYQHRPQVLVVHTEQMAVAATLAAGPLGIPVVLVVHGVNNSPRLNTPHEKARIRAALREVDRIVLVGDSLSGPLAALTGSSEKFRIVHNGVNFPSPELGPARALAQRPVQFISVSNLVEGKGVDINLQALAVIDAAGLHDWQYTIVGGGSQADQLRKSARRLGIDHKVRFVGAIPHSTVYELLVQASVFLLPSWQEAFGVAWLEAMACGLLTIAVEGQGPAAFIKHDETGLLVSPRSVNSVVACLHRVFSEPEFLQKLAQQGQSLVVREFSWDAHARQLAHVCGEVLVTS